MGEEQADQIIGHLSAINEKLEDLMSFLRWVVIGVCIVKLTPQSAPLPANLKVSFVKNSYIHIRKLAKPL